MCTMPQAGFDPLSAEVQTSTECEFDAFTLQATTAGRVFFLFSGDLQKVWQKRECKQNIFILKTLAWECLHSQGIEKRFVKIHRNRF